MKTVRDGDNLTAFLTGELDHRAADGIKKTLELAIADRGIRVLTLDVSNLTFMDSSGIGVVIGRYKTMKARGGEVRVAGATGRIDQLFEMAGIYRIVGRA